jgi:hypothetical protein
MCDAGLRTVVAFRNDKTGPPISDPLCLCVSAFLVLK